MAPPVRDGTGRRSLLLTGAATVVVAGLGGGITYVVMAPSAAERVQAALPGLPDLADAVPPLGHKLIAAHERVRRDGEMVALADYGRLLQANGFAAEATQTWRILIKEDPADGRWPYYLAHLYRDSGDIGETTALLQATVKVAPDYTPAWLQLGDLALKSGKFAMARIYYDQRLSGIPGDPYARLGLARIELQENRREMAVLALAELSGDHPPFASAHNLLSRLYREDGNINLAEDHRWKGYQAGRFATAEDPWMRELHRWCFTPEKLFVIGMVDFQTGRGDRGRTEYERAAEVDPQNPGNHELLGDYYRKLNESALARDSLARSIALAEAQGSVPPLTSFINLAALEREEGNFVVSRQVVDAGIAVHPRSPELRVESGLTRLGLGQFNESAIAFQQALERSPHDTVAHFHLGELQLRADRVDLAMTSFQASLVQQPTFALSLRYLLQYSLSNGLLAEAGPYADTLLTAYWGDPEVRQLVAIYDLLQGRAELAAGRTQTAIKQFQRGFELNPNDVELAFELGTLQLAQANFRAALAPLESLLERRPEDPRAHLFLAQAYVMDGRNRRAQALLETGLRLADAAGQKQTAANIREILSTISR